MDIVKFTFNSDALDCSVPENCQRKKLESWSLVLAIAPQSANNCFFLLHTTNEFDQPVVMLLNVDLAANSATIAN